jgi:nitrogen regulatory protein P-II 1
MKEIKAYLHRQQVAAVIQALKDSGCWGDASPNACHNVAIYQVQGSLSPASPQEEHYSIALAEIVTYEYKIELVCDDARVDSLLSIVSDAATSGRPRCGWIFVVDVERAIAVN